MSATKLWMTWHCVLGNTIFKCLNGCWKFLSKGDLIKRSKKFSKRKTYIFQTLTPRGPSYGGKEQTSRHNGETHVEEELTGSGLSNTKEEEIKRSEEIGDGRRIMERERECIIRHSPKGEHVDSIKSAGPVEHQVRGQQFPWTTARRKVQIERRSTQADRDLLSPAAAPDRVHKQYFFWTLCPSFFLPLFFSLSFAPFLSLSVFLLFPPLASLSPFFPNQIICLSFFPCLLTSPKSLIASLPLPNVIWSHDRHATLCRHWCVDMGTYRHFSSEQWACVYMMKWSRESFKTKPGKGSTREPYRKLFPAG